MRDSTLRQELKAMFVREPNGWVNINSLINIKRATKHAFVASPKFYVCCQHMYEERPHRIEKGIERGCLAPDATLATKRSRLNNGI